MNVDSDSVLSDRSFIKHLTKALGTGNTDKSTIFKALKKK